MSQKYLRTLTLKSLEIIYKVSINDFCPYIDGKKFFNF